MISLEKKGKEIPVIMALPRPDFEGGFIFWCPFCKEWHKHGRGPGHRAAHCYGNPESPFYETGYILKPITKAMKRKLIKALKESLRKSE